MEYVSSENTAQRGTKARLAGPRNFQGRLAKSRFKYVDLEEGCDHEIELIIRGSAGGGGMLLMYPAAKGATTGYDQVWQCRESKLSVCGA